MSPVSEGWRDMWNPGDFHHEIVSRLYKHTEMGIAVKALSATNTLLCSFEKKLVKELILSISNSGPGRSLKPSLFH